MLFLLSYAPLTTLRDHTLPLPSSSGSIQSTDAVNWLQHIRCFAQREQAISNGRALLSNGFRVFIVCGFLVEVTPGFYPRTCGSGKNTASILWLSKLPSLEGAKSPVAAPCLIRIVASFATKRQGFESPLVSQNPKDLQDFWNRVWCFSDRTSGCRCSALTRSKCLQ